MSFLEFNSLYEIWDRVAGDGLAPFVALGMIAFLLIGSNVRFGRRRSQARCAGQSAPQHAEPLSDMEILVHQVADITLICLQMQEDLAQLQGHAPAQGAGPTRPPESCDPDLYEALAILGFNPTDYPNAITEQDVKARFRMLIKIHHPDVGADGDAMKQLVRAYDRLKEEFAKKS